MILIHIVFLNVVFIICSNYRVFFTGNCGKVMGNNTAVYQVIQLLLYYLYCLTLDTWEKNIRNKIWTSKFFLERFQFLTQMPLHQIRCNLVQSIDYWFWSVCLVKLRRNTPNSLPELTNTVERHAASLNKDRLLTAVNDILPRAQACIGSDGGAFEYKLKSSKKKLNR